MAHSYFLVTILYESKMLTSDFAKKLGRLNLPLLIYSSSILGFCGFVFVKNSEMSRRLDKKYTPLWKSLVEETKKQEEAIDTE